MHFRPLSKPPIVLKCLFSETLVHLPPGLIRNRFRSVACTCMDPSLKPNLDLKQKSSEMLFTITELKLR